MRGAVDDLAPAQAAGALADARGLDAGLHTAGGHDATDDAVVRSFLDDVDAGGALRTYLGECRLGYRAGATLFLHGGITSQNLGVTPGAARADDVDAWRAGLDRFYRDGLAEFAATGTARALIAYQAPLRRGARESGADRAAHLIDRHEGRTDRRGPP